SPNSTDYREYQLAGCGACVGSQVQNREVGFLGFHPVSDVEQMLCRTSEPVQLRDNEGVAFTDEIERRLKLRSFTDRRSLLVEDLLASGRSEIPDLGIGARLLLQSAGSRVTDLQAHLRLS